MNKEEFKSKINLSIDHKATEVISQKTAEKYLTYLDAKTITVFVGSVFMKKLKKVPPQVQDAMLRAEATISPTAMGRIKHVKSAASIFGGVAGIALIITGVLTVRGTGRGIWDAVKAFFNGAPFQGSVGMIAGGTALAAIAGYFAFSGNPQKKSEVFLKALKSGIGNAIDVIWAEHGNMLSQED